MADFETAADKFQHTATKASSWYDSFVPSRQTITLFGGILSGITLIGATTYFVATRYIRKKRSQEDAELGGADHLEDLSDEDMDEEEIALKARLASLRDKRRGRLVADSRPPPLITFAELFEQALQIEQQRSL